MLLVDVSESRELRLLSWFETSLALLPSPFFIFVLGLIEGESDRTCSLNRLLKQMIAQAGLQSIGRVWDFRKMASPSGVTNAIRVTACLFEGQELAEVGIEEMKALNLANAEMPADVLRTTSVNRFLERSLEVAHLVLECYDAGETQDPCLS